MVRHLKHLTEGLGADVVIDAVGAEADGSLLQHVTAAKLKLQGGSPVALNWAIDTVRKGARSRSSGPMALFSAVKFGDAMNKGLTLRMNQCPVKRQWPRLFEHIRNGYFKPSDVITHHVPLEHIAEGYHMFSAKLDNCIKPIVVPGAAYLREELVMTYTPHKPPLAEDSAELRARIPGWGADLDPADRPVGAARAVRPVALRRPLGAPRAAGEVAAGTVRGAHPAPAGVWYTCPPKGLSG